MSEFQVASTLRSLVPSEPGPWLWSRLKVYLAVLAAVVFGFFFMALWYAAPTGQGSFSWLHGISSLLAVAAGFLSWRISRRELEKQHHRGR